MEDEKREESEDKETTDQGGSEDTETGQENGGTEKTEMSIDNNPDKIDFSKTKEKIQGNPWMVISVVLLVAVIVLLVINFRGGITGNVVSEDAASKKILDFADSQGVAAELVEVNKKSGLYEIILSMQGREVPVYLTLDGENLVSGLTPLGIITQQTQQEAADVPKSDKPQVELFVMSFCPYGVEAQKILVPVAEFFGKTIDARVRFVYYAMHGKKELDENLVQYCVQEEEPEKYWNYLNCFVESEDTNSCINEAKITKTKIDSCVEKIDDEFKITEKYNDESTWLSGRYPLFEVEKEIGDKYGVGGSEALIINGVKISPSEYRWDVNKLKTIICSAFNTTPEECNEELNTVSSSGPTSGSCE